MITPRPGPGVCGRCFNFTLGERGELCRACAAGEHHLRAVLPIAYAPAGGSLHRLLADYKRAAEPATPGLADEVARILSSFLAHHESCLRTAAGVRAFDAVTVVPSGDARRDQLHPLRRLVADFVPEVGSRFCDVLRASGAPTVAHRFDPQRFIATGSLTAAHVLLIDDVWTTGASAQSAAAVLEQAGVASVSVLVIGRYVNGFWGGIADRIRMMEDAADPDGCAFCGPGRTARARGRIPSESVGHPAGAAASYTRVSPSGGRSSVG